VRATALRALQLPDHPRVTLALKTALAAHLAWLVAGQLPGVAQDYPYYAPMGAVIAMYPSLSSSVRESLQGVLGIVLGAVIAVSVDALLPPGPAVLAVVVAAAVLVGGLPQLGDQRSWVPTAALFVLVIGTGSGDGPGGYALAYAGLTLMGSAIAVGVNWLLPSLPIRAASRSSDDLREALADQLHAVAEQVQPAAATDRGSAPERAAHVQPLLSAMRASVHEAAEAARANRRAGRHQEELDASYRLARELERAAFLVQDLTSLVQEDPWERSGRPLEITLRAPLAEALHAVADVLASVGPDGADSALSTRAQEAVHRLSSDLRRTDLRTSELLQVATATTALQRCLAAVAPSGTVVPPLADDT